MARISVLIVDDDPDQHTVCGVFLEHAGYRVMHAFDGQEGVEIARAQQPDLVLMDIRMRRMDGGWRRGARWRTTRPRAAFPWWPSRRTC